jgi:hypothetical protein
MSLNVRIQSKAEQILRTEARFYGVKPTALAKAIFDKVVSGELTRDVLQGVDVSSYERRERQRARCELYHFRGADRTLPEIQKITGVSAKLIASRLNGGWKLEKAATTPARPKRRNKMEDGQ